MTLTARPLSGITVPKFKKLYIQTGDTDTKEVVVIIINLSNENFNVTYNPTKKNFRKTDKKQDKNRK